MADVEVRFGRFDADGQSGAGPYMPIPAIEAGDSVMFRSDKVNVAIQFEPALRRKFDDLVSLLTILNGEPKTFVSRANVDLNVEIDESRMIVSTADPDGANVPFSAVDAKQHCNCWPGC